MRLVLASLFLLALWGCNGDSNGVGNAGSNTQQLAAYLSTDPCSGHVDEAVCSSDTTNGCDWVGLGIPCPDGTDCPSGVCQQPDPCRAHGDAVSCESDAACAWASVELCPPPGDSCPGGFCYTKAEGCTCACPLYCPAGEECPPCDCACPPDPGGGGDCTCVCADCPEGETCPPCDCSCDGGGGCGSGTCTCACPACAPGEECPPCDCRCDDGSTETSPETCVCPACAPGETCPPCTCDGGEDPCLAHTDEATCVADATNQCQWIAMGMPCSEGEPCVSGVCQGPSSGGGDGCTCVCPECAPGESCPPCDCAATGSSEGSGAPPAQS